jgi:hypothetical protein
MGSLGSWLHVKREPRWCELDGDTYIVNVGEGEGCKSRCVCHGSSECAKSTMNLEKSTVMSRVPYTCESWVFLSYIFVLVFVVLLFH